MNNKIEKLRSILFTREDFNEIENITGEFTPKDIEFMVEFKKIYELGLDQLQKFVDKLEEESKELDSYSILYYMHVLNNGPLGGHYRKMIEDKPFYQKTPDSMGSSGNNTRSSLNTTLYEGTPNSLGCAVETFNRLPQFMQLTLKTGIAKTEEVFRSSLKSSTHHDNTLPIVDKKPQERYNDEEIGEWVLKANGSYLVKDSFQYNAMTTVSEDIFKKVGEKIGEEPYRLFKDKKRFDPFSNKNESKSENAKLEKYVIEGERDELVTIDLMGDVFDSEERRESVLKVENASKDKEYLLNSLEGQLGI